MLSAMKTYNFDRFVRFKKNLRVFSKLRKIVKYLSAYVRFFSFFQSVNETVSLNSKYRFFHSAAFTLSCGVQIVTFLMS